jgi:2'-5' RNA ligase
VAIEKRLDPHLQVKRWYGPEVFHLTTHFLGDLDDETVRRVIELVTPHTREQRPFRLRLDAVGWFPRAKVVWCGLAGDLAPLRDLHGAVARSLSVVGAERFAHDKFRPHVTMGRLREVDLSFKLESVDVSDLLAGPEGQGLEWEVDALHLFESVSGPAGSGPSYPIRETFWFGK